MRKGKILVIVLALLLVILIGAGTAFFLLFWPTAPIDPSEQRGEITPLGEFVVNVQHQRSLRIVRTEISLEMVGGDPVETLERNRPKIRDAIISVLRGSGEEAIEDPTASDLKEQIAGEVNRILGEEKVRNVFFTEFVVQ